jgi:alcohol dehydrogenase YqhD (iron-dependent ADH family)
LVRKGIGMCLDQGLDFVLGVGGGSSSDSAKAIAAGVKLKGDIWGAYEDFHTRIPDSEKNYVLRDALPFGVVMTKAGTGSDFDCTSVMTNWDTHEKLMVITPVLFPKFTICDPELTFTLPADQTAYGTADMMTHVFEQYFSHTSDAQAQDRIKEGLLKTMIECGPVAIADPTNYSARANLLYCASWACSQLAQVGVVNDWASHLIEQAVGAHRCESRTWHGGNHPGWMRYVIEAGPKKFAQYGERVGHLRRGQRPGRGLEAIDRTQSSGRRWELRRLLPRRSCEGDPRRRGRPCLRPIGARPL